MERKQGHIELLFLFYLKRPALCKKNSFIDTVLHIFWSQVHFPTKSNSWKVTRLRTKQQMALLQTETAMVWTEKKVELGAS